jgi:hypothetical protein
MPKNIHKAQAETKRVSQHKLIFDAEQMADGGVRDLSAIARTGNTLWAGFDEGAHIERLFYNVETEEYGQHTSYALSDFFDLAGDNNGEVDIEGLCTEGNYLWVIGSHSSKRDSPDADDDVEDGFAALADLNEDENRYLLGRIPMLREHTSGEHHLYASCPDPDNPKKFLRAACLPFGDNSSQLIDALAEDEHFSRFLTIPCKENGFDIEGLEVIGDRIFIGLRGPVLSSYAVILEVQVKETNNGDLKLKKIGPDGERYRKHFVHLQGMGIRELAVREGNIYILAGPTMDCDGTMVIWRLKNGFPEKNSLHTPESSELERVMDVVLASETEYGKDKAEGLCPLSGNEMLVVYDSPSESRLQEEEHQVLADVFEVPKAE